MRSSIRREGKLNPISERERDVREKRRENVYICVCVCVRVCVDVSRREVENWGLFIKKRGDGDGWIFNKLV